MNTIKRPNRFWDTFRRIFKTPSAKLGGILLAIIVMVSIFAPLIAPYDPFAMDYSAMHAPSSLKHLCGTDDLGRDILSRLIYGGRYSLTLGILADLIGQIVGIAIGSIAGYFGGRTDNIIMRILDIWQALPSMLLTIILSAVLGAGFFNTIIALSIGGIPRGARMTRGQILAERGKEYLEAAQSINCSSTTIMFTHLLPNVISPSIVSATMQVGGTITMAAGLSYLGLGIQPPTPEWGAMLSEGTQLMRSYPHVIFWPGLTIGICVLAINLIGDGLRDALDPKLRN
ncbi:MAG: ABC transporter permease [Lachnospiraceae bacterium]|nr:ABC transporter permease [Lachnospiraceae bacterium]